MKIGSSLKIDYGSMIDKPESKISEQTGKVLPYAENVEFIERGDKVIRVMDKHNFYEAENMTDQYLIDSNVGLLTKLWIYISKTTKE
jgi:hypothetical protein